MITIIMTTTTIMIMIMMMIIIMIIVMIIMIIIIATIIAIMIMMIKIIVIIIIIIIIIISSSSSSSSNSSSSSSIEINRCLPFNAGDPLSAEELQNTNSYIYIYIQNDVMICVFPQYWSFVRGIHRSSVDSRHKRSVRLRSRVVSVVNLIKQPTCWRFKTPKITVMHANRANALRLFHKIILCYSKVHSMNNAHGSYSIVFLPACLFFRIYCIQYGSL